METCRYLEQPSTTVMTQLLNEKFRVTNTQHYKKLHSNRHERQIYLPLRVHLKFINIVSIKTSTFTQRIDRKSNGRRK